MSTQAAKLPIIDLSSPDRLSIATSIRQACLEYGFFYLVNHGVEEELIERVFEESRKFFALPLDEKMKLVRREHRGYTPVYAENLDPSSSSKGDSKESFYIGPLGGLTAERNLNQWPVEDVLPHWRLTMESYYVKVLYVAKRLISLLSLALNLSENYFEKVGALDRPECFLRLLNYPGDLGYSNEEIYGASAHSDYGMITLLMMDGVPGLQVCREKVKQPRVWEDVLHLNGLLYDSSFFSYNNNQLAFFLDPNPDCIVECLESCCSESNPKRFPPIRSADYLKERFRLTYGD